MLTTDMTLSLLGQTLGTRYKTILQRHSQCFTKFTHQDKNSTHHQSWLVIKIVKEIQNGPRSLAQSSLVVIVMEHQSLHMNKNRHELCVEKISLDKNLPRRSQVHCLTDTQMDIWQQYCSTLLAATLPIVISGQSKIIL